MSSTNEDHAYEREGNESASKEVDSLAGDLGNEAARFSILDKEDGADEDEGAEGLDERGLFPVGGVDAEMGEVVRIELSVLTSLALEGLEEDVHREACSTDLGSDHDGGLDDV